MAFFPFLLCVFSSALFSPASLSSFCFSRWCCRRGRQWQLVVMMKCSVPGVPPCCCSFFFLLSPLCPFLSLCFFLCFFRFFPSLLSVSSSLLSVSFSAFLVSIYRAKGVAFYCSHGE
jgi:hypothetical protein